MTVAAHQASQDIAETLDLLLMPYDHKASEFAKHMNMLSAPVPHAEESN